MDEFYCLTFDNIHNAIKAEKQVLQEFSVRLIPVPRKISATCGLALRFDKSDWPNAVALIKKSVEYDQAYLVLKDSVEQVVLMTQDIDQK